MKDERDCPCGTTRTFGGCCGPTISGKTTAPTAEALMRARYSSYATGAIDFIERSQAPEGRGNFDRAGSEKWAKESEWLGLNIVSKKDGGPGDATGTVSFIARYKQNGEEHEHQEIGVFRKDGDSWLFVEGRHPVPRTIVNDSPAPGRNAPCSCGSGKKFKKCHGQ